MFCQIGGLPPLIYPNCIKHTVVGKQRVCNQNMFNFVSIIYISNKRHTWLDKLHIIGLINLIYYLRGVDFSKAFSRKKAAYDSNIPSARNNTQISNLA